MNATQAPAAARRPPEKGSFPLDHYGECKPFMKASGWCVTRFDYGGTHVLVLLLQAFLACMKEHEGTHIECKHLSAEYLKCRMDKCVSRPCLIYEKALGD
jgi:cytochrome c oxidase assembly protein subunit 19